MQNDVLVTITGANVTKSALVCQPITEAYVSQHVALVRLVSSDTSAYVYYWIAAPCHGRHVLEKNAYGAGNNLRELRVALPAVPEQRRIVSEVERRLPVTDGLEAAVEANLKRAAGLRQAILKRAFEGKLVPQEPNDEPARTNATCTPCCGCQLASFTPRA
jgi:type I restriction enzyme, S subunit